MKNGHSTPGAIRGSAGTKKPAAMDTQRFVISRISTLNVLLKRRAAIYARRSFAFTLTEWRILTLLRTLAPISVRELSLEALTDAAQVSRAVAGLVSKGYLSRTRSPLDNRENLLTLTKPGLALSEEMCRASLDRNDELLRGYSRKKIAELVETLDSLIDRTRALVQADEAAELARSACKTPPKKSGW
jgi:DNA-binding MarR family transcriptional regulator